MGVEVRSHYFCSKITTDSPKPVTLHHNEASTKLLQEKAGVTITLYSKVLRSAYRCRSYSEIGAYIHGGKRKAFAT